MLPPGCRSAASVAGSHPVMSTVAVVARNGSCRQSRLMVRDETPAVRALPYVRCVVYALNRLTVLQVEAKGKQRGRMNDPSQSQMNRRSPDSRYRLRMPTLSVICIQEGSCHILPFYVVCPLSHHCRTCGLVHHTNWTRLCALL